MVQAVMLKLLLLTEVGLKLAVLVLSGKFCLFDQPVNPCLNYNQRPWPAFDLVAGCLKARPG